MVQFEASSYLFHKYLKVLYSGATASFLQWYVLETRCQ